MFSTGPSVRPCVRYIPACPGRSIRRPACCQLLVLFCSIVDNGFSVRYQNISRENRAVVRSETTLVNSWLGCDRHSRSFTIPECYLHISCTSQVFIRTALDYHCIHVCLVHISCFFFCLDRNVKGDTERVGRIRTGKRILSFSGDVAVCSAYRRC